MMPMDILEVPAAPRGPRMIERVLKHAGMANAEDRGIRNVGDLVVVDARGEGGPMFKRLMPRCARDGLHDPQRSAAYSYRTGRPRGPSKKKPQPHALNLKGRRPMGQKVHPTGFRVGIMEDWRSRWYASKHEFSDLLVEDFKIRKFIKRKYSFAG